MAVKTVQATINGQTYTLTLNSTSGKYEATVTAPSKSSYNQSGHYYGVTVKATDVAGNITTKDAADATLGKSLRLQVKEKVAPIIAITAPTVGTYLTNNKPTITWKVTDADFADFPKNRHKHFLFYSALLPDTAGYFFHRL